jgi:inhibitor of cysteine peptidase
MKARLIFVSMMTVILLGLVACSSAATKELSVDISSSGKEVTLAAGGTLTVTLESNVTTGYSWNENANIGDKTVMQQTDHKYQPPATPIPGAGGKEVWTFKALKTGKSRVSMEYRRPFEQNTAPAKTFTLTVVVH